jgi:hypothetical protein
VLGIVATLGVVLLIIPYQGHGWGYRYLHGCLGSVCLLAARGWISVTARKAGIKGNPGLALVSSAALSLLVLLPWRSYQVNRLITPYAVAAEAIGRSRADVVIVDSADIWYGTDLVRNDPLLRTSPKVMNLFTLDEAQLRALCQRYDVAIFGPVDAPRFGLRIVEELREPFASRTRISREVLSSQSCGRPFN